MDVSLAHTPLFEWHSGHGGRLVDFAGWAMPIQYSTISAEHVATRQAATLFDVSHMGRFRFTGEAAGAWLQGLVSRRIDNQQPGAVRYSLVTRDDGGVLDDILVYRLPSPGEPAWMLVVNASNRQKIWDWLQSHEQPSLQHCSDETLSTAMIAVQGPLARNLVIETLGLDELKSLKNYQVAVCQFDGAELIGSRTGYTGEDGFELIATADQAATIWQRLIDAGANDGVLAAGLGARDTLRLEAAMPLYGHELDEQRSAAACGLNFALHLDHEFPGRDAIAKHKAQVQRVGFAMQGRRVARQGAEVLVDSAPAGTVTSGTFSPTLQQAIGMAYVDVDALASGPAIEIDIRGKREQAAIVPLPFYRRTS